MQGVSKRDSTLPTRSLFNFARSSAVNASSGGGALAAYYLYHRASNWGLRDIKDFVTSLVRFGPIFHFSMIFNCGTFHFLGSSSTSRTLLASRAVSCCVSHLSCSFTTHQLNSLGLHHWSPGRNDQLLTSFEVNIAVPPRDSHFMAINRLLVPIAYYQWHWSIHTCWSNYKLPASKSRDRAVNLWHFSHFVRQCRTMYIMYQQNPMKLWVA